jgi:hypothetical protein
MHKPPNPVICALKQHFNASIAHVANVTMQPIFYCSAVNEWSKTYALNNAGYG